MENLIKINWIENNSNNLHKNLKTKTLKKAILIIQLRGILTIILNNILLIEKD